MLENARVGKCEEFVGKKQFYGGGKVEGLSISVLTFAIFLSSSMHVRIFKAQDALF